MKRVYHRAHLRSPVYRSTFFTEGKEVILTQLINISAGGLLFKYKESLDNDIELSFLTCVPQTPHLKNFNDHQLFEYDSALFPSVTVRTKGKVVRAFEDPAHPDGIFMGVKFSEISDHDEVLIEQFAQKAASNVSFLQALIDAEKEEPKIYKVAEILGYNTDLKIKDLKNLLQRDLTSLKWT